MEVAAIVLLFLSFLVLTKIIQRKIENKSSENYDLLDSRLDEMNKNIHDKFNSTAHNVLEKIQEKNYKDTEMRMREERLRSEALLKSREDKLDKQNAELKLINQNHLSSLNNSLRPIVEKQERLEKLNTEQLKAQAVTSSTIDSLKKIHSDMNDMFVNDKQRGNWGEMALEKVLEYCGMKEGIHFVKQNVQKTQGIPDMIIKLPKSKEIVIDAKTPLKAYKASLNAKDESERKRYMKDFVKDLKNMVNSLSEKKYFESLDKTPELVIMYIPIDAVYHAANNEELELLQYAMSRNVLITSPVTLLGSMKAILLGWKDEEFSKNSKILAQVASELSERVDVFINTHFSEIGNSLKTLINRYDKGTNSINSRIRPHQRKIHELASKESKNQINDLIPIEKHPVVPNIQN
tara:strand:- start:526 stop:1743 length:1218 start_codon:yes stop_codon:yes gene_type:complete